MCGVGGGGGGGRRRGVRWKGRERKGRREGGVRGGGEEGGAGGRKRGEVERVGGGEEGGAGGKERGGGRVGFEAVAKQPNLCVWNRLYASCVLHASPAPAQYAIDLNFPLQSCSRVPTPTALWVTSRVVAWAERHL